MTDTARTATITLDKPRTLRLDFNALAAAEEATGVNFLDPAAWTSPNVRVMRALLWALLRHEDPTLTIEQAGAMMTGESLEAIATALAALLPSVDAASPLAPAATEASASGLSLAGTSE